MSIRHSLAATLFLASLSAAPSAAQDVAGGAVFLVRLGPDTLAVENATIDAGRAESVLRLRSPLMQVRQLVLTNAAAIPTRVITTVGRGARGDSAVRRIDVTIVGDSAIVRPDDDASPVPLPQQRIAVPAGALPFVNLSSLSIELMLRRARAAGGASVSVPLLLVGGGGPATATVSRAGADSVVIVIAGVTLRARTDAEGRLLGAVVPAQNVVFERLPAGARAGAWTPAPASYAPPPDAPYSAEEVVVRTPAGLRLAGTFTRPRARGTRWPAVVLITGSGAQDRDEATPLLGGYRPFREIADTLARRGIAVLRLDDRGVGGSDAGPAAATTADFAADVRAAVAWLRTRADVAPTRVGLVGHSEGGVIAPMVAATDPALRAIVLVAAPAERGREIIIAQQRWLIGRDSALSEQQRAAAIATAAHGLDSATSAPGWLRWFAGYDPLPAARRVRVPVLLLQGETDRQVPAAQANALAGAMRAAGNRRVTVRTFPRMNHMMLDDPSGDWRGYAGLPSRHVRQDLLGALADWLARTL